MDAEETKQGPSELSRASLNTNENTCCIGILLLETRDESALSFAGCPVSSLGYNRSLSEGSTSTAVREICLSDILCLYEPRSSCMGED